MTGDITIPAVGGEPGYRGTAATREPRHGRDRAIRLPGIGCTEADDEADDIARCVLHDTKNVSFETRKSQWHVLSCQP